MTNPSSLSGRRFLFCYKPYKERKLGLKKLKNKKPNDIIIDGLVGTDFVYAGEDLLKELPKNYREFGKYFSIDVSKNDIPKKLYFEGMGKLSFDGFLSDEDYKAIFEEELLNYEYEGYVYLVGIDYHEKDWIYGVAGDFSETLPNIFNIVRVRISPLEFKVKNRKSSLLEKEALERKTS